MSHSITETQKKKKKAKPISELTTVTIDDEGIVVSRWKSMTEVANHDCGFAVEADDGGGESRQLGSGSDM